MDAVLEQFVSSIEHQTEILEYIYINLLYLLFKYFGHPDRNYGKSFSYLKHVRRMYLST